MKINPGIALIAVTAATFCAGVQADTGKLLLTGGVSSIDGAAGGGLTPWATIGSNATDGEIGGSAYVTNVGTKDYGLNIYGVAVGFNDRFELSINQQDFDTKSTGAALKLPGLHLKQTIVGAKRSGTDFYVSATKLFLGQGLLVNGTLRATKANQNGLLGFGATLGGNENSYSLQPELSVGYLVSKNVVVGAEYRFMRNKLETAGAAANLGNGLRSQDWKNIFVAWAPSKNLSVTLAYVDLGVIVPATTDNRKQTGYYLSAQVAF